MSTLPDRSADYGTLAQRISGWTTNILAAAIVIAIGLALGWQITGWFREPSAATSLSEGANVSVNLPAIANEHEFLTSSGLVKVQRQNGTPTEAIEAMRAFCREKPLATQPRTIGPGEAAFVKQLMAEPPLEQSPPIALFQPPGQALMVVAVDRERSQIVGWSFATPAPGGAWSLYHFRPK
ncbi:MAG TPA: hypothetical protein VGI40_26790 [Pirellulaceae bacterium]|jgi:hypothetical protein